MRLEAPVSATGGDLSALYKEIFKEISPPLVILWKSSSVSRLHVFSRKLLCMSLGAIGSSPQGWRVRNVRLVWVNALGGAPYSKILGLIYRIEVSSCQIVWKIHYKKSSVDCG